MTFAILIAEEKAGYFVLSRLGANWRLEGANYRMFLDSWPRSYIAGISAHLPDTCERYQLASAVAPVALGSRSGLPIWIG
jgi:hypothetical protein